MLVVANTLLEAEAEKKVEEREKFLADKCPPMDLPYSRDELLVRPPSWFLTVSMIKQVRLQAHF